jgi:hypothetical protein
MSAAASLLVDEFSPAPTLTDAARAAFLQTVLEHRGLFLRPTAEDHAAALEVLDRFNQQRQDNPSNASMWMPHLDEESRASLQAKTFLMFGVTKPSPAQWQKAHNALFGPLLCDVCG